MSSTNPETRGGDGTDLFPTPRWVTNAILPQFGSLRGRRILETSAGDGAIVEALISQGAEPSLITAVEFRPEFAPILERLGVRVVTGDFLHCGVLPGGPFDIAIQNPPFSGAQQFVEHARRMLAPRGILASLGRLAFFLAGQKRRAFRKKHPFDLFPLSARPSFSGEWIRRNEVRGTDMKALLEPLRREKKTSGGTRMETLEQVRSRLMGSDSADYCWALYGEGRGGRFETLEEG